MPLTNPVPGSDWSNNGGYEADSGLDILVETGTACVAAADGVIEYAEDGHTPWIEDTDLQKPGFQGPKSVRIRLNEPVQQGGRIYRWVWYTHLTEVEPHFFNRHEVPVRAGELIGKSGIGNKVPHLHFGVIADREQNVTMGWQGVAELIWGPKAGKKPASRAEPAHPPVKKAKFFVNGKKGSIVFNGQTIPAKAWRIKIDGEEIDPKSVEILVDYVLK